MKEKIKVLVVDDSALVKMLLTEILNSDSRMEVVGCANDPYEAREMIKKLNPDVLTLDIEMPKMNGIAFLKNLMRLKPMPVVMISTLTQEGAPAALEALECGAVDFLGKPQGQGENSLLTYRDLIIEKVYWASKANIKREVTVAPIEILTTSHRTDVLNFGFLCAIGASTGGTEAIKDVVRVLPENGPPIVATQHIPDVFSTSFAKRLDSLCKMKVYEAEHDQVIEQGSMYLAPGHSHLTVIRKGQKYYCQLDTNPPVNRHRPSVEVLFDSVRQAAGDRSMGVILTGMGADGAEALLRLRQCGAFTVAQDEATSVVWGMPGSAVKLGAADKILPLAKIPQCIMAAAFNQKSAVGRLRDA
jgi:two-component system, chemotaxis family, protein-glutamate methylesterase/glutaminase